MACRVGITTNPEERKRYWQTQHPRLSKWQILGTYSTKAAAQEQENKEASKRGCTSSPGGSGPSLATWYVYYFEH